ncbi:diguanylate cyclase [Candidatus Puniceispirillum sp.]|uniref:diguanylate cyclase n=1 Tax=Candidatus Puniceispirillum sp. TaxID=2026719 RepID=UPI003F6978EB
MKIDIVLFGGLGFLLLVGALYLASVFVSKSDLSERAKRILHYAGFATVIIACILMFDWYSKTYLAQLAS